MIGMGIILSVIAGLLSSFLGVALLKAYNTIELHKKKYGARGMAPGADRRQRISFIVGNVLVLLGLLFFYNACTRKLF
jgi:hypothetical protein